MSSTAFQDEPTPGIAKVEGNKGKMPAEILAAGANASPFHLDEKDVEVLLQSEGFAILREHLAEHYADEYVLL